MVFWTWERKIEINLAVYQFITSCIFWFTGTLDHSAYDTMTSFLSPKGWALLLMLISIGHVASLYLDTQKILTSVTLRALSCVAHLGVLGFLAYCALSNEIYWLVWTLIFFCYLLLSPLKLVVSQLKEGQI